MPPRAAGQSAPILPYQPEQRLVLNGVAQGDQQSAQGCPARVALIGAWRAFRFRCILALPVRSGRSGGMSRQRQAGTLEHPNARRHSSNALACRFSRSRHP